MKKSGLIFIRKEVKVNYLVKREIFAKSWKTLIVSITSSADVQQLLYQRCV